MNWLLWGFLWHTLVRNESPLFSQSLRNLSHDRVVGVNVFLLDVSLRVGDDLAGQLVVAITHQLHILHVHLADLVFDLREVFVEARLLGLHHLNVLLTSVNLFGDGSLNLFSKLNTLQLEFALFLAGLANESCNFLLLVLHLSGDDSIRLLGLFHRV